jgi:hypothetical protein
MMKIFEETAESCARLPRLRRGTHPQDLARLLRNRRLPRASRRQPACERLFEAWEVFTRFSGHLVPWLGERGARSDFLLSPLDLGESGQFEVVEVVAASRDLVPADRAPFGVSGAANGKLERRPARNNARGPPKTDAVGRSLYAVVRQPRHLCSLPEIRAQETDRPFPSPTILGDRYRLRREGSPPDCPSTRSGQVLW